MKDSLEKLIKEEKEVLNEMMDEATETVDGKTYIDFYSSIFKFIF